jgi:site-specific DNA recombinase
VVVVHRLDRLSRSLFDLSDLLPLFAVQGVELVSVTQSIDTHTPNGRLSLNLLTSFAEFEREIIGERTRDKLAATRRQGRWQGNGTPLGYAVDHEQRLVVVPPEAELVNLRMSPSAPPSKGWARTSRWRVSGDSRR